MQARFLEFNGTWISIQSICYINFYTPDLESKNYAINIKTVSSTHYEYFEEYSKYNDRCIYLRKHLEVI